MKRVLPYPVLTVALLLVWLAMNDTLDPAHLLLGLLVGVAGGLMYAALQPPAPHGRGAWRAVLPAAALLGIVLLDLVRSNIAVARICLGLTGHERVAGFLRIPLALKDPGGLAVLACIVTATPGTSWAQYDAAGSVLTLHVLDLVDEEDWVRLFKDRYERRLMEIFE